MIWTRLISSALLLGSATAASSTEFASIQTIQGDAATSPMVDAVVKTEGVVTAVQGTTFYIQAVVNDGDDATSDGLIVKSSNGEADVGDLIVVEGRVAEAPAGRNGLTVTMIDPAVIVNVGTAPVPAPVELGAAGLAIPTDTIGGPGGAIELLESLEGMLVAVTDAQVVGPTNERFHELWVVADRGTSATGMNSFGGITATASDQNPERIQVQLDKTTAGDFQAAVGDVLPRVVGPLNYAFGNFEIVATELQPLVVGERLEHPVVEAGENDLTVGSYNVENLDAKFESIALLYSRKDRDNDLGDGRFTAIAEQIVTLLHSPDIVALQEVQDDDGGEVSDVVSSRLTLSTLIAKIAEIDPSTNYEAFALDPVDDAEGGQLGGNIRVAYLFDPDRVQPDLDGATRIDGNGFASTRLPLAVDFLFGSETIRIVNVHLSSKGGSDPLFGAIQPPQDSSVEERSRQVDTILAWLNQAAPAPTVVLGDFNSFYFEAPMTALVAAGFKNLTERSPEEERASYIFEGNSQALDHVVVDSALAERSELYTFHANSVLPEAQALSDHDPKLLILRGLD